MVRNKIKMFAQQKVTLPKGRHKIVILDEADRYANELYAVNRLFTDLHLMMCPHIISLPVLIMKGYASRVPRFKSPLYLP